MLAGASAVGVGTAIAFRGLTVFSEISRGISSYLARAGLTPFYTSLGGLINS
ncbi:MAG TPA: hypothetical protein ENG69_05590 [Candidatus Korarchaeota archaeon]|nr:hypothetical protein [Candidatus Korarchaeota archaeon]